MAKLKIHELCPSDGPGEVKAVHHRVGNPPKTVRLGFMCLDCFALWPATANLKKPWSVQKPLIGPRPHPQQYRTEAALRRGIAEAQSYFAQLNGERIRRFPIPEEAAAAQNRRKRNQQKLREKHAQKTQEVLDRMRRLIKAE